MVQFLCLYVFSFIPCWHYFLLRIKFNYHCWRLRDPDGNKFNDFFRLSSTKPYNVITMIIVRCFYIEIIIHSIHSFIHCQVMSLDMVRWSIHSDAGFVLIKWMEFHGPVIVDASPNSTWRRTRRISTSSLSSPWSVGLLALNEMGVIFVEAASLLSVFLGLNIPS